MAETAFADVARNGGEGDNYGFTIYIWDDAV